MWTSLLEDSFSLFERNLFFSYVVDTLRLLHSLVKELLPEREREIPTLAAVLRLTSRSYRIRQALYEALKTLGLCEEEMQTLCTFFITYCFDAQYLLQEERQQCTRSISDVIEHIVKDQLLQKSLKSAVFAIEKIKAIKSGGLDSNKK